jgi:hypothetical protein
MKPALPSSKCQHVGLAQSQVGEITLCPDCRVVHISLQYFSMRFDLDAFDALTHMLATAQSNIARMAQLSQAGYEALEVRAVDVANTETRH